MTINAELGVVVVRHSGVVTADELMQALEGFPLLPGFRPGLNKISDFRAADLQITADDVRKIAAHTQLFEATWGTSKWLFLASETVAYGLGRMYASLTADYMINARVFKAPEEADEWFGVDVSDILAKTT